MSDQDLDPELLAAAESASAGGPDGDYGDAALLEELEEQEAEAAAPVEEDLDLARLARERDDYLDALRRVQAEFENYRKRVLRQQTEHLERAAEGLVEKLLPVLDTFDLALAHDEGFEQVLAALMAALEKEGLERIQPDDEPFDPNEHDAVAHEADDDHADEPAVAEVLRPGYRWKGRVLRPAMVRVKG